MEKYTKELARVHLNSDISFNHKKHKADTELLMEYWRLKELKTQPQVPFYILK